MSPPRVDHKIYSRGPSAQSAWRVYEYTGQWPHELVKGFEPTSWAETFSREFARLLGISHEARNVEIKDVLQQLKSRAAERQAPRNCLTRPDISQVREWLRDEKGVTATRCKMVRRRKEESVDESEKGSESEAQPDSDREPKSEEEDESEAEAGSDPEPLPEINVHDSDDSTSDSSSDDDEMEIDESTPSATTRTRLRNGQSTSKQSKQPFPTPSITPEDARKRFFDGLDEHYRRAVRRAAMAKKRQFQPQPKPQLLLTPPASGGTVPPKNKGDDRASSTSPLSEPPITPDEPWPKRLRTRAENVSLPDRHGQFKGPLRRESTATIPDSNAESDENSRDTAPASPGSVSSSCDEHEPSRAPSAAPATAAPPATKPFTVALTTTSHALTPSNENISSTSIDFTSATGRPRRNIQPPSRIAHSQPQSAVASVEKSRKRLREPIVETREHPMSLESSPESEELLVSAMGSLARNDSLPAASSVQHTPTAGFSSLQTGRSTTSRMSIASLLQVPVENAGSESPSPATLGRDGESSNPPQSNSPPTTVSPPAKKQKVADTRATGTSSDVDTTQPTEESSDEDLPDWDALIADWDAKAARVVNVHTNIQENRIALSEKSKYVKFLEHMHRTNPPDEDGRKHYEHEKKKLGEIQFVHGMFIRGFEEAKQAAVANADPDVTLAEQARRMGASKRKREGLTH